MGGKGNSIGKSAGGEISGTSVAMSGNAPNVGDEEEVETCVLNTKILGAHHKTNVAWKSVGGAGLAREATSPKSTELEDRKRGPKPTTEGMLATQSAGRRGRDRADKDESQGAPRLGQDVPCSFKDFRGLLRVGRYTSFWWLLVLPLPTSRDLAAGAQASLIPALDQPLFTASRVGKPIRGSVASTPSTFVAGLVDVGRPIGQYRVPIHSPWCSPTRRPLRKSREL